MKISTCLKLSQSNYYSHGDMKVSFRSSRHVVADQNKNWSLYECNESHHIYTSTPRGFPRQQVLLGLEAKVRYVSALITNKTLPLLWNHHFMCRNVFPAYFSSFTQANYLLIHARQVRKRQIQSGGWFIYRSFYISQWFVIVTHMS